MAQPNNMVSVQQLTALMDFLEQKPELALGRLTKTKEGRSLGKRQWSECAEILNCVSANCCTKSGDGWRLYYNEYKSKLLKKIKAEKREIHSTGGGPAKKVSLTPIQERLYAILGHDVGDPLPGVRHNPLTEISVNMTEALVNNDNNLTYIEEVVDNGSPIVIPMSQETFFPEISVQEPVVAENSAEQVSPTRPRRRRRTRPRPQQPHSQESNLEAVQVTLNDIERRNAEATLAHAAATNRLAAAIEKMAERLANPIEIIVVEKPRRRILYYSSDSE